MNTHSEDLVSLDELRSVLNTYAGPDNPGERPEGHRVWRWRSVSVAAVALAALVSAGVAIAAGFGAFNGISAAQHPQGPADKLDPALAAAINAENAHDSGLAAGKLLPDSARFIRQLAGGERIYALSTTTNMLCVLLVGQPGSNLGEATSCGDPLSQSEPTTITSVQPDSATPPLAYGIAIDSVTSVSFTAAGQEVTVPVKDNVWAYQGENSALDYLTLHFNDGSTELLHNGVPTS